MDSSGPKGILSDFSGPSGRLWTILDDCGLDLSGPKWIFPVRFVLLWTKKGHYGFGDLGWDGWSGS